MNSTVLKEEKVSINELINISAYSIEETTVPSYDKLEKEFSDTWADMYLDEDLREDEGKHCYIINDDCNYNIRGIVVSDELNESAKMQLLDIMDNVIYDLLYNDIIEENIIDEKAQEELYYNQSYSNLLEYIRNNNITSISNYEYSWLLVLAENMLDLVTL